MTKYTISKVLTANDSGESGGHQAGILVPKEERFLSFFPPLERTEYNPRVVLRFEDQQGQFWKFSFIYYNNRFFGGTRNEYRLTHMTKFIRQSGLVAGDEILMHRHENGEYGISYKRAQRSLTSRDDAGRLTIRLGAGWKVVNF